MIDNQLYDLCHEYFRYSKGKLYWKKKSSKHSHVQIGDEAGCIDSYGYNIVVLFNKHYSAHRLIFLMHKGYLPNQIDHKDTNKNNNRINNLREATGSENCLNKKINNNNNTSGTKGLHFWVDKRRKNHKGYWVARIVISKKRYSKYFKLNGKQQAIKWLCNKREEFHGAFVNHG